MNTERQTRFAAFLSLVCMLIAILFVYWLATHVTGQVLSIGALIGCLLFITARAV